MEAKTQKKASPSWDDLKSKRADFDRIGLGRPVGWIGGAMDQCKTRARLPVIDRSANPVLQSSRNDSGLLL